MFDKNQSIWGGTENVAVQETTGAMFSEPFESTTSESSEETASQPSRLRYCGVLKQLYDVLPDSGPRCPFCGYLEGDL